jgi:hypothetical protein
MRALDALQGLSERVVKLKYADKEWSDLRVKSRKNGEPHRLELSRFSGCVGAITAETLEISADADVRFPELQGARGKKATA